MSSSKILGYCLIAAGILWLIVVSGYFISGARAGKVDVSAAILGGALFALPIGLGLIIGGGFVLSRAMHEAAEMEDVQFEGQVLDMIEARGSIRIPEIARELECSEDEVKEAIYDLVDKRLFTGYANWDNQRVYSEDAADMPTDKCPNCGGELELAGKGVVVCPYCGTETFLPEDKADTA